MSIKKNVEELRKKIKQCTEKNGISNHITICAATKYVQTKEIEELVLAGIKDVGENRVDALLEKKQLLPNLQVKWHMIGTLQSRKVKEVINQIDCLHSLNRLSLANAIEKYREKQLDCYIQVNCSLEPNKHGITPEEITEFVQSLKKFEKIKIVGLMTMAEHTENDQAIRETFKVLKQAQIKVKQLDQDKAPCNFLSMGMSNDYHIAIEEGATIIRVGSKLFK